MSFDPVSLFGFQPDGEQLGAITAPQGVNVVQAGPGSGKTSVVICRILYLTEVLGVRPEDITVLVFNREARAGLAARLKASRGGSAVSLPEISTIHAKCYRIVTASDPEVTGVDNDSAEALERILGGDGRPVAKGDVARIAGLIARSRETVSGDAGPEDLRFGSIGSIAEKLEAARGGKLSFEDMQVKALRLIEAGEVRRPPHLLVDEAQDLTELQFRIVRGLAGPDLFMVGDSDQCIYAFRYADSRFIDDPERYFEKPVTHRIGTNYRCTGSIVRAASLFINALQPRDNRPLLRSALEEGEPVEIRRVSRQTDQFRMVLDRRRVLETDGIGGTVCALYRNNLTGVALVNFLLSRGVTPSYVGSKCAFLKDEAVKRIVAGVRRAMLGKGEDYGERPEALVRHICVSEKIIPETTAEALRERMSKTTHHREYRLLLEIAGTVSSTAELLERLKDIEDVMSDKKLLRDPGLTVGTVHSVKGLQFDEVFVIDLVDGAFPGTNPDQDEAESRAEERLMYVAMTRAGRRLTLVWPDTVRGGRCRESGYVTILKKQLKSMDRMTKTDKGLKKSPAK